MIKKILIVLVVLSLLTTAAFCRGHRELPSIVVATDPTYPPMEFLDDSGEIAGFDIELMKAAAKAGGFSVEFKNVPWGRIFDGLKDSSYNAIISGITITEERKKTMDFSIPYIEADQVMVVDTTAEDVESIEDLTEKRIGVLVGSTSAAALNRVKNQYDVKVVPYSDAIDFMNDLIRGKISAVVTDLIYARILTQDPRYRDKLKIVSQAIAREDFGVAVKKGNKKVLTYINEGLKRVIESGENRILEEKWLGIAIAVPTSSQTNGSYSLELEVIATPQEITPKYLGNTTRWEFDVILYNNTDNFIVLGPIYDRVYDTDTGFSARWAHYGPEDNWHKFDTKIAPGSAYRGHHYIEHAAFYSGMYEFIMTASSIDNSNEYEAKIVLVLLE